MPISHPRYPVPVTARVLRVLEAADGPVRTEEMEAAIPDVSPISIRTAIWRLRRAGLVSKQSPRYVYELSDAVEARRSSKSVQLLRLDPSNRMVLTVCDGKDRVSVQLSEFEASEYGKEMLAFVADQKRGRSIARRWHEQS